ncbi:hypothetical protein ETB97_007314 [Aspergillus alliaceus]|uniref:Uncharacterized protein n=1 Tax=Petromyces alliaceus TaxID=209559 RepID=A0A8H5ZZ32_PETAA|nr:hypothetical protein ETB97_007314 [Aspergillus burnettii]
MSAHDRSPSPDFINNLFPHKTWPGPWSSRASRQTKQVQSMLGDSKANRGGVRILLATFFSEYRYRKWPWGYFIHRAVYSVPEEDWAKTLEKINRYIYCTIHSKMSNTFPEPTRLVWQGYRNVITEDGKLLEEASVELVRRLFKGWVE